MKRAILAFFLPLVLFAQGHQFAGVWQTIKSPRTGKPSITVALTEKGARLSGTVTFVNPDGSEMKKFILNAIPTLTTLSFETDADDGVPFHWKLTIDATGKATLRGSHREMLIEERVSKRS